MSDAKNNHLLLTSRQTSSACCSAAFLFDLLTHFDKVSCESGSDPLCPLGFEEVANSSLVGLFTQCWLLGLQAQQHPLATNGAQPVYLAIDQAEANAIRWHPARREHSEPETMQAYRMQFSKMLKRVSQRKPTKQSNARKRHQNSPDRKQKPRPSATEQIILASLRRLVLIRPC